VALLHIVLKVECELDRRRTAQHVGQALLELLGAWHDLVGSIFQALLDVADELKNFKTFLVFTIFIVSKELIIIFIVSKETLVKITAVLDRIVVVKKIKAVIVIAIAIVIGKGDKVESAELKPSFKGREGEVFLRGVGRVGLDRHVELVKVNWDGEIL
jgi:hypothetical protein